MALTRSASQFLTDMRQRTDNEGVSATDRFPDSECLNYLNRAISEFYRIMVETRSGGYKIATIDFNTTGGVSLYPLQANFYRLLNVMITIDSRKQWLVPMNENERADLSDTGIGWAGRPLRYTLRGDNIEFLPVPTSSYPVEIDYVPDPPTLLISDSFDCVNADGMNFIIDTASKYMAEKDENWELSQVLSASIARLEAALRQSIPNRDQNMPPRIQDVRFLPRGGSRGLRGRWN